MKLEFDTKKRLLILNCSVVRYMFYMEIVVVICTMEFELHEKNIPVTCF